MIEEQISDTEFIFSGRIEIDYINEKYKLGLPESDDFETLNGFIIFNHESIPNNNEVIRIDRFKIKIIEVSSTRIDKVKLILIS